ncbi:glycosyltransferase family 2 protein [Candidatus Omnitrophota bacterium]
MNQKNLKKVSVVIPVVDEEENVEIVYEGIRQAMNSIEYDFEVIFVDDGSMDETYKRLEQVRLKDRRVKIIKHRRNFGKAAAYSSGFTYAHGDIVITMDGDLQDDPKDIPKFIDKINEGYDLANGWKHTGKGPFLKRIPSKIFNKVTSLLSGVELHDFNCPFKAYRHEVVKNLNIYGDLYRFIPILAIKRGFVITEIKISNFARIHGKSKYGANRFINGFLDLLTVLFLTKFARSPLHLYGAVGLFCSFIGGSTLLYLLSIVLSGGGIGTRPLLTFGVLLFILGIQFISVGLICEMIINTKNFTRDKVNIREILD